MQSCSVLLTSLIVFSLAVDALRVSKDKDEFWPFTPWEEKKPLLKHTPYEELPPHLQSQAAEKVANQYGNVLLSTGNTYIKKWDWPAGMKDMTVCRPCESPFLVHPKGKPDFLLCTPYKNGFDWWSSVACVAQGRKVNQCDEFSKKDPVLDRLYKDRDSTTIRGIETNKTVHKVKLVRSPVTRVLAAWLTWVGQHDAETIKYLNEVEDHFPDFVDGKMLKVPNPHWTHQVHHCSWYGEVEYKNLKVEDRGSWGQEELDAMGVREAAGKFGGLSTKKETACPGHGCSAAPVMKKYYTLEAFDKVVQYYWSDIVKYGYEEDTRKWRKVIEEHQAGKYHKKFAYLNALVGTKGPKDHLEDLESATSFPMIRSLSTELEVSTD